jgi:predicted Mrr-cat superfamily restriction endonuclease
VERHWVLKTTEGRGGRDYWDRFLHEGVIAIGWHEIAARPHVVSQEELESSVRMRYPNEDAKHGARTIKRFVEMGVGDRVLLSQGYAPNQSKDVYIYGFATVTGGFYDDASSDWWTFKHAADIRPIGRRVPKSLLERTLCKSSMLLTLHEVRGEGFERLESRLRVSDE